MTSSKHTPGPWRFSPYYSFEKKRDVPNRYNGIYEPIPGQEFGSKSSILTVGIKGDVDDYWIHCSDANARLIEASPDLLEALKAVVSAWEVTGPIEAAERMDAAIHAARAAIAKAEAS